MAEYRRAPTTDMERPLAEPGPVLAWDQAVIFLCPCGEREIYITSPPHEIEFDEEGRLTLNGSVGSREKGDRPANWCHFRMRNGECRDVQ